MSNLPKNDDSRWEEVGQVGKVYMYPLKSCAPNSLQKAEVGKFGLTDGKLRDRAFMVVDQKNRFITGRQEPRLVLIKVGVVPSTSKVQFFAFGQAGKLVVDIPSKSCPSAVVHTEVHGQPCKGYDLGDSAAEWITSYIGPKAASPYRIIYHDFDSIGNPGNERKNPMAGDFPQLDIKQDDTGLFADGFGFLLVTSNSMNDLNLRLVSKGKAVLDERWFRPNIYVQSKDGIQPYDEDNWEFIRIGETVFRVPRPCTRCIFTTVHPTQGTKDEGMEPLKTLRSYRSAKSKTEYELYGNSPLFGVNLAIDDPMVGGSVCTGETVYIIRRSKKTNGSSLLTKGIMSVVLAASAAALVAVIRSRLLTK